MSLDFHIEDSEGNELFWENYPHNGVPMWEKAGVYDALYMSQGKPAGYLVGKLAIGVWHFERHFAEYQELDSPNGWGRAIHALPFLCDVLNACRDHPYGTVRISK